ncbi:MAG: hypothetical protein ABW321_02215, partial [Polyangiales bacterium]
VMLVVGCVSEPAYSTRPNVTPAVEAMVAPLLAPESVPLYLDVWMTVHGTAFGPLLPQMSLHSGDRIGVQARTSSAAGVYLVHCDGQQKLSVYPSRGPRYFRADERVELPEEGFVVRLDGAGGREFFYVIASKRPLQHSDRALHTALFGDETSTAAPSCGGNFRTLLAGPQPRRWRRPGAPVQQRAALRGLPAPPAPPAMARGMAMDDGIVVLQFPFEHLP